jgi:hypothetical protein
VARPLSSAEVLAIHTYTSADGDYREIHQVMLGLKPEDKKIQAKIDLCVKAMKKLPDYPADASPLFRLEKQDNRGYSARDQRQRASHSLSDGTGNVMSDTGISAEEAAMVALSRKLRRCPCVAGIRTGSCM